MCQQIRPICVSVREACLLLSVKKTTLFGLLKAQELVSFLIGGRRMVMMDSIDDYVDRQVHASRK